MRRSKGFSLLEVVIAMAILGFIMAALYASLYSGTSEYEVNSRRAWAVHQARLVLDQMTEELRQATRTSVTPPLALPNAPAESAAVDNISFKMALPGGAETPYYVTYMWAPSGVTDMGMLPTVMLGHTTPIIPIPPGTATAPTIGVVPPTPWNIGGATWVDGTGHNQQTNYHDNGMLVRIDQNTSVNYPFRNVLNNLQGEPDMTAATPPGALWTPGGFRVTQSVVKLANNEQMIQIHLTLNLVFTDTRNNMLTQTLESKVFVRNIQ